MVTVAAGGVLAPEQPMMRAAKIDPRRTPAAERVSK
jgi:hypothetical protein